MDGSQDADFDAESPYSPVRDSSSPVPDLHSSGGPPRQNDDLSDFHSRGHADALRQLASWCGAAGWAAYFPDENESDKTCEGRAGVVHALKDFFLTSFGRTLLSGVPPNSFALPLDFEAMLGQDAPAPLRSIASAIRSTPEEALPCIGLAASRAAEIIYQESPSLFPMPVSHEHRLWPRIYNFTPFTSLRSLKGSSVGKFISVHGTVVRVSTIRQQIVSIHFECGKCQEVFSRSFVDYKYSPPSSCPNDKCRSRTFLPQRETAETVDWQKIRVQEILDQNNDDMFPREEGRMPRTIDAELFADLIDSCIPGDIVTITGVVRVLDIVGFSAGGNRAGGSSKATKAGKSLYYLYIHANSTMTSRESKKTQTKSFNPDLRLYHDDGPAIIHRVIREVVRDSDPFAFLVHSAVPSIYGHEIVKAGMLLSLFGGAPRNKNGVSGASKPGSVTIRRDIHCLVVGDPGIGKSQMLKAMSGIAPRGVYVCGNTTSTSGLTVTVVRESSGDFALEAGALVLGDRGVCCIDEFDKMGADHGALLEAMEQQSVSVAKAGLLCNLSARTTVIAAANPAGGHYDRSKTVCENLKIALPLLSRFDLVFILVDNPDEERDRFISEHVMAMFGMRSCQQFNKNISVSDADSAGSRHVQWRKGVSALSTGTGEECADKQVGDSHRQQQASLLTRLRKYRMSDPLPPFLFRQYVAYAKEHVHPELSEGAKRVFQDFYLTLRKGAHEQAADTTPITTRQLESLVRLGEARARSVMRTVVTEADAHDVVEIMRESMLETLTDETGQVDLGRSSGMSRSRDARLFVAALHAEAQRTRSALFDKAGMKRIAQSIGIDPDHERFDTLVETINYQGYVTLRGRGRYELQSSSFSLTPTAKHSQSESRDRPGS